MKNISGNTQNCNFKLKSKYFTSLHFSNHAINITCKNNFRVYFSLYYLDLEKSIIECICLAIIPSY